MSPCWAGQILVKVLKAVERPRRIRTKNSLADLEACGVCSFEARVTSIFKVALGNKCRNQIHKLKKEKREVIPVSGCLFLRCLVLAFSEGE